MPRTRVSILNQIYQIFECIFTYPLIISYIILIELQDLLPGIINQLGPDNLANLKKIAESFTNSQKKDDAKEDDEVPDLVDNFEEAAKSEKS